ncbi:hypothetical protein ABZ322_28205, partial [Streptomyces sp. NPDC006129]
HHPRRGRHRPDVPGRAAGRHRHGAFDALLPAGHVAQSQERATREQAERRARAALGDTAYETAYAQGGGLGLDEAVALL